MRTSVHQIIGGLLIRLSSLYHVLLLVRFPHARVGRMGHIYPHKGMDGWIDGRMRWDPRKRKARLRLFMFVYFCRMSTPFSSFFDGGQKKDTEEWGTKGRSEWATEMCLFSTDGVQGERNSSLLLSFEWFSQLSFSFFSSRFFLNIPFSSILSAA